MTTVTQVQIVEIFSQSRDGVHSSICNITALCKNEVSKSRCYLDNLVNCIIRNEPTIGEVKDAERFKNLISWKM
jgi:hypothetical protein